jgi:hypothetical protein
VRKKRREREREKKKKLFGKEKEKKKKKIKFFFLLIYITYETSKIWDLFQFGGLKPLLKWLKGWVGPVKIVLYRVLGLRGVN